MKIVNLAQKALESISSYPGVSGDVFIKSYSGTSVSSRNCKIEETLFKNGLHVFLRVIQGNKSSCVYSNNIDIENIKHLVDRAIAISSVSDEDACVGLPERSSYASDVDFKFLDIFDDVDQDVESMSSKALEIDNFIVSSDGIFSSDGVSLTHNVHDYFLCNTNDFSGSYKKSFFSASVGVLAENDDKSMTVDSDFLVSCKRISLQDIKGLASFVVNNAKKRINPRKVVTCKVPVIFSPQVSNSLVGHLMEAVNGFSVSSGVSFLSSKMNHNVFSESVNILDDPMLVSGILSSPFDAEGCKVEKKSIIKEGVLSSWLLDSYTCRKLGLSVCGNANRNGNGGVHPCSSNVYLCNGDKSVSDIISGIESGFYITDIMGSGVDIVTGNYSRSASGFWIEDGQISFPVSELALSGNLGRMFQSLIPANDLALKYSINAPTVMIPEMLVGGI